MALSAVASCEVALDQTLEYVKRRTMFGKRLGDLQYPAIKVRAAGPREQPCASVLCALGVVTCELASADCGTQDGDDGGEGVCRQVPGAAVRQRAER